MPAAIGYGLIFPCGRQIYTQSESAACARTAETKGQRAQHRAKQNKTKEKRGEERRHAATPPLSRPADGPMTSRAHSARPTKAYTSCAHYKQLIAAASLAGLDCAQFTLIGFHGSSWPRRRLWWGKREKKTHKNKGGEKKKRRDKCRPHSMHIAPLCFSLRPAPRIRLQTPSGRGESAHHACESVRPCPPPSSRSPTFNCERCLQLTSVHLARVAFSSLPARCPPLGPY